METYLVGGAVRDFFLQHISQKDEKSQQQFFENIEKDWVVVGATIEDMLAAGYRPVGKSFPVFLHPITQDEYALARIERKISKGYTGFECFSSPDVSLEDDLKRRDLTINAMALPIDEQGVILTSDRALIDPFSGFNDLEQKIFRHISPAFAEDPVRILRVARFAARFEAFIVHQETNTLMRKMVEEGEVDALTPERVWQELLRALQEKSPLRFFEVLEDCGALAILFPELTSLQTLNKNLQPSLKNEFHRFAALLHHLPEGKLLEFCARYRIPNNFRDLALLVARQHEAYLQSLMRTAEQILTFLEQCDAIRRKDRFYDFLEIVELLVEKKSNNANILRQALGVISQIDTRSLLEQGLQGIAFAEALRKLRIEAIDKILNS